MSGFLLKMTNFINIKTNKLLIFIFHINIALEQKKESMNLIMNSFYVAEARLERTTFGL